MKRAASSPGERYAALVQTMLASSSATLGSRGKKGFGESALQINDKIFAMLARDRLVVKLPRARIDELIEAGAGERFDPGHGRLMKEWIVIAPERDAQWRMLAEEALAYVGRTRRT